MSPKKKPPSLHALCMKFLSNQLIQVLSDEEGKYLDQVEAYMYSATYDTLQALLNEILGMINLDASTRFSCLQVLLREDVRYLEVGIFPRFYYDKILETVRGRGKGLRHLNLKGVWVKEYPQLLSSLVYNLSSLKCLIVPHISDDSVISSITSLSHLVKLDISGEACYTSTGIKFLKSETLRILDIGSFGKRDLCHDSTSGFELVAEIIDNLPNLNVLKTYSFTGHALSHSYKKDNNFRTKLTYLHSTDCSLEILEAIVQSSPFLESVHINCPQEGVVLRLGELKKLHSLKLTRGDSTELLKFLETSGHRLQVLKLNHSKTSSTDLAELCEFTPSLNTLECYLVYLKYTNPQAFMMSLQNVDILYCDIDDSVVKTLLTNAPFLKSVRVGSSLGMTDGDMFRLLGECTLGNLEELVFTEARFLTAVTVQLLAENCPKLRILGSLVNWDVTDEEIDALRVLVLMTNTDLTLWPET